MSAAGPLGTFAVNIPADAPNLAVGPVRFSGGRGGIAPGSKARGSVSVKVANAGPRRADGRIEVKVYASADPVLETGDTPLGSQFFRVKIRPGGSRRVRVRLDALPPTLSPGAYYLLAYVDDRSQLKETSKLDNTSPATARPALLVVSPRAGRA